MRRISQDVYDRIDNSVYSADSERWWQPESAFYQLRAAFNPARVGYAKKIVVGRLGLDPRATTALDVGCGGGFVTEELARLGFNTTGVDPSEASVRIAAAHALESGLRIRYMTGTGESLPFGDGTFGAVFCCDVLEHVRDLSRVIAEIGRVLEPGGVFCYDTINRTWLSYLAAIKVSQVWKRWAFMPPNLHVWRMFVKPREMKSILRRYGLEWREQRGLMPSASVPRVLRYLRQRARGELTYSELAGKIPMVESPLRAVMFMGYAVKELGSRPAPA
jgi:2-polyprenyl-6-hydroxyphenyl methylase/3-demethylubiquinone-9 3-methyltransferase